MKDLLGLAAIAALGLGCAKPCDINADGKVDGLDYVSFQDSFNSTKGDPNFNERADFDGDDYIGGTDFSAYVADCGGE